MADLFFTDEKGTEVIKEFFKEMLPTKEESKEIEKTYSIGFIRFQKLSIKKRKSLFMALFIEGFGIAIENHEELKRRLAVMTEEEFKAFKNTI